MTTLRLPLALSSIGLCLALSCNDAAAASGRQTTEPVVARVLQVSGQVQIKPASAAAFAAADNTDLVASDRIDPAEGAYAIVGLDNGYVVRIDDTGALAVKSIVMLRAPPTTLSVEAQLAQLTDLPTDFNRKAVTEKAAAWRQMPRAAESALRDAAGAGAGGGGGAVGSLERIADAAPSSATDDADTASDEPARDESAQVPTPKAARTPSKTSKGNAAGGSSSAKKEKSVANDDMMDLLKGPSAASDAARPPPAPEPAPVKVQAPPSAPAAAPPQQAMPVPAPSLLVRVGPNIDAALSQPEVLAPRILAGVLSPLGTCRDVVVAELRVPPEAISFRVLVKRSQIIRVSLGGALSTPKCALPLLGQAVDGADGWYVVTLP